MAPVTQATDAGAIEKLVVDAALAIAAKVGWEQLRLHAIADRTGLPLAEIGRRFRDVDAVANAWFSQARIAVLGLPQDELDGRSADERIALALGVWLDSLAPHRRLAGEILRHKLYISHPHHWVPMIFDLSRLVHDLTMDVALGWSVSLLPTGNRFGTGRRSCRRSLRPPRDPVGGRLRADRARLRLEWHSRGRTDLRPAPAVRRGPRTLAGPAVQVLLTDLMPLE